MTTTGKVLIGGLALTAVGAGAYYFFVARKQVPSLLVQNNASQPSSSTIATAATPGQGSTSAPSATPAAAVSPYEGKVIRADQEPAVYWVINGVRHGFLSPDALHRSGFDFPQVQSVPKAIVMAIPEGSHISGLNGFSTLSLR